MDAPSSSGGSKEPRADLVLMKWVLPGMGATRRPFRDGLQGATLVLMGFAMTIVSGLVALGKGSTIFVVVIVVVVVVAVAWLV